MAAAVYVTALLLSVFFGFFFLRQIFWGAPCVFCPPPRPLGTLTEKDPKVVAL